MSGSARPRADGPNILQTLDVEHFAQARVQELEFLDIAVASAAAATAAVTGKDGGGQAAARGLDDQSQALPRHMRRRPTSHKPRRMTVAQKNSGRGGRKAQGKGMGRGGGGRQRERDVGAASSGRGGATAIVKQHEAGPEQRCRKHRRRPKAMLQARSPHVGEGEDHASARWLETHIWHAKRMHMEETWGFMLPIRSNRGPRAVMQAALKHCTLQDVTFLRPLEIRGTTSCLLGLLSTVTDPLDGRPSAPACVQGSVEAETHLYRVNQFPLGCVGPANIMWNPAFDIDGASLDTERVVEEDDEDEDPRTVWLWVHPAAAKEALAEIRKACVLEGAPWAGLVDAGLVAGGLCRLRVRGHRAHEVVHRTVTTKTTTVERSGDDRDSDDTSKERMSFPTRGGGRRREAAASFEQAAEDNARRWHSLGGVTRREGVQGNCDEKRGPTKALLNGSILALTSVDPRELPRGSGGDGVRGSVGGGTARGEDAGTSARRSRGDACQAPDSQSSHPGGENRHANDPATVEKRSLSGQHSPAAAPQTTQEPLPPLPPSAAISPLWDADARNLSAKLADARPDHVLNEGRRRERSRTAWDVAGLPPATAAGSKYRHGGGNSGRPPVGETPVILIWSSGTETTAHRGMENDSRGGSVGGDRRKEVEKKRRSVGQGWDIVTSAGWASVFFNALVIAGARAISLADADTLALEARRLRYPADYPDTYVGCQYWDLVGAASISKARRTRPKHRGFKLPSQPLQALQSPRSPTPPSPEAATPVPSVVPTKTGDFPTPNDTPEVTTRSVEKSLKELLPGSGVDNTAAATALVSSTPKESPEAVELAHLGRSARALYSKFRPDFGALARGEPTGPKSELDVPRPERKDGLQKDCEGEYEPSRSGSVERESVCGENMAAGAPGHVDDERNDIHDDCDIHSGGGGVDGDGDENDGGEFMDGMGTDLTNEDQQDQLEALGNCRDRGQQPFAVARGFHYFQAFLPPTGAGAAADAHDALPPPSRLAMPTMLNVKLWLQKGVPQAGALIYAASPKHITLWEEAQAHESNKKPWSGFEVVLGGSRGLSRRANSLSAVLPPAIGAVTTGGFSFLCGNGVGRGVCEAIAVRDALAVSPARRGVAAVWGRDGKCDMEIDQENAGCNGEAWGLALVGSSAQGCSKAHWLRPCVFVITE